MLPTAFLLALACSTITSTQQIASDPGTTGPPLEVVHLYNDGFGTGIAVSSTGRKFSNYPPSLDAMDTKYTVAELTGNNTETLYPSAEINYPPGGCINYTTCPPTGANYQNYLIGVQRYLNDVRPNLSSSGHGIAYITDSSTEGRNGLITVDLGTSQSWRHLDNTPEVRLDPQFLTFVWGEPFYFIPGHGMLISFLSFGSDGIALSADGETLYWSAVASRYLYSIPTARLRDHSVNSEILAQASMSRLTQKGVSDGLETDSNGYIYMGDSEQNAINIDNPANGSVSVFIRDPRIGWSDTMSVSGEYLYFTENQLWKAPGFNGGVDRRVKSYVLNRVQLPDWGGEGHIAVNTTKLNAQKTAGVVCSFAPATCLPTIEI